MCIYWCVLFVLPTETLFVGGVEKYKALQVKLIKSAAAKQLEERETAIKNAPIEYGVVQFTNERGGVILSLSTGNKVNEQIYLTS